MTSEVRTTAGTAMTAPALAPDEDWAPAAPRTATEEQVAAVWCELLEVEHVSLTDNFFELGGHSLLATQAVFGIADRTGMFLELESFFDLGTVAEIAAEIDRLRQASAGSPDAAVAAPLLEDPMSGSYEEEL